MRLNCSRYTLVAMLVSLVFCVAVSYAGSTATVTGLITDHTGAVVPAATVVFTNINTNVPYSTQTNGVGIYSLPALLPGVYRANVSKDGFKSIVKGDIELHVQDQLSINFELHVGSVSESITVEGGAPLINTEDAAVSTVIDRKFVESLPLNGRSFNTLLQLTPGVVVARVSPGQSGQFSIAGQRTDANNFTVDGVSANFGVSVGQNLGETGTGGAQAMSAFGGTSSLVSVDALQEFRIETSSYAPEFGRTPGGQVILTTRSGTNQFHGGAFDYFRNTVMDANNWFNNAAKVPRTPEHHNDFGGFLGGPIWKDRTFFFFSYEGARLRLPNSAVTQVPFLNGTTCSASAAIAPFLNSYPKPNGLVSTSTCTGRFTGGWSNSGTLDATSIRIDHTLNQRFSIFGRYNHAPSQIQQRTSSVSLSDLQSTSVNTQTLTVGMNMLLSPRISNTLRGNYSTQRSATSFALDSFGGAAPLDPTLLLGNLLTSQSQGSFVTFDTSQYLVGPSGENRSQQLNFADDLAVTAGLHQLKFGGDYRAILFDVNQFGHTFDISSPSFSLVYASFSVKQLLSTSAANLGFGSISVPAKLRAQSLSLYGQDTWKATPRLTLTYGLRWELSPAPSARGGTKLPAWDNTSNPAAIALAPFGTPMWATTYGNFAPRAGVAYGLTSKGDFVLRAGGGIFYDLGVGTSGNTAFNFTNTSFASIPSVPLPISNPSSFLPTISLLPPFPDRTQGFSRNLKLPRSYQWNVALEKSFGGRQVLTATYLAQAGRDLLREGGLFKPNSLFQGNFLVTLNEARSNYEALQVQFRRPLASRLQALLNYTWSHSLDSASNDVTFAIPGVVISAANDYASSNFDVRHSFSGALSYDVPAAASSGPLALLTKGWSLQTIIVVRTGFPFNASVGSTSPVSGVSSRPDRVAGQPLWISDPTAAGGKSLNPAAFSIPSTKRQGTEGRNDIPGFGLTQVDLSIGRKFRITERLNLQFRGDAFNVLNHPNFSNPNAFLPGAFSLRSRSMLNQGLGGLNPLFQEGGPRSLQLSLKMTF